MVRLPGKLDDKQDIYRSHGTKKKFMSLIGSNVDLIWTLLEDVLEIPELSYGCFLFYMD